jgi:isoleucyl-tRNA synthetase
VLLVPWDLRDAVEDVAELLAEELNVRELSFAEDAGEVVRATLRPDYRTAGPELGDRVRDLAKALEALDAQATAETAAKLDEGSVVEIELADGQQLQVSPELVEIRREPAEGTAFAYEPPFGVSLDLAVTSELRREGMAREFVHQAQSVRRDLGLEVTDRVHVVVAGPPEVEEALREYEEYVAEELLATDVQFAATAGEGSRTIDVDGNPVSLVLRKTEAE